MAFCTKCGSSVAEGVAYCSQCGAPIGSAIPGSAIPGSPAPASGPAVTPAVHPVATGLSENVAGLLCYLLGWLTGIVFLLIDKRPFVRFHAAQSIVVFGGLMVLRMIFRWGLLGGHAFGSFALWAMLSLLITIVAVVAWIVLMVTAYRGKRLEVPIAARIAKSIAGNPQI